MRKLITTCLAVLMAAAPITISTTTASDAQERRIIRPGGNVGHPNFRGARPYQPGFAKSNRGAWYSGSYRHGYYPRYGYRGYPRYGYRGGYYPRYGYYHRHHDYGAAVGAGIVGLAAGAIIGGALSNRGGTDAVAACEARFRSYDRASGTYLGYDGRRHACP